LICPAVFRSDSGSTLVGSAARDTIDVNEVYLYVPSKLLITVDKALSHEVLGPIYEEHGYFFKGTPDRDYLVLLLFMIYEHQKGPASFWHPYFTAIEPDDLPCHWDDAVIELIEDRELREQIYEMREDVESDWDIMKKLMRVYPETFDLSKCT